METIIFEISLDTLGYMGILGMIERNHIATSFPFNVGGGRTGTWNSAAHFIVRAVSLMKNGGRLGFLVPNSILRVKQFKKTRDFILNQAGLWKIVDEGSPFDGVTLEMVSLFLRKDEMADGCVNLGRIRGFWVSGRLLSYVFVRWSPNPLELLNLGSQQLPK